MKVRILRGAMFCCSTNTSVNCLTMQRKKICSIAKPRSFKPHSEIAPWYTAVPVGKNKLAEMVKTMAINAGIRKDVTYHSLRAYGVSKLFQLNVPEKLIMERSGHRSTEEVRQYEQTNEPQVLQVRNALAGRPTSRTVSDFNTAGPSMKSTMTTMPVPTPVFAGSTFNNCTFQIITNPKPPPPTEDFSDIDIQELFADM